MWEHSLKKEKDSYGRVFLLCFLCAAALFAPHCIIDGVSGGFFHYAGDFNDQQISFYTYMNSFLKQGGGFSWATDLGSGGVNAYSFYLMGSPFFWLSMLLPARLVPWAMVPLLCLKFGLAGGGAFLWLRRWVKTPRMAVLGAFLYAFSGFSLYNIFFNHFVDVIALFPYLLAALDAAMREDRRGPFAFWVAVNLLNNYFFFAGQAVFLVIYFICMLAGGRYRLTARRFAALALETLLGCAMGCVLLVPAALSLVQNPRTIDPFSGYGYLLYGKAQQYAAIFYSLFLVPEAPYLTDLFDEGIIKWTSLTAYLPVVGIAGGLAFCRARRSDAFSRILRTCLVFAFVPVLNSLFYCLNSSYYARWYYMPILILCAATVLALEDETVEFGPPARLMALATVSAAAFALVPNKDDDGNFRLGVVPSQPRFWGLFAVTLLGLALLWLVLRRWRHAGAVRLGSAMLAAVVGFTMLYGTLHLSYTKYGQWQHDGDYVQQTYAEAEELAAALPGDGFYRIDAYDCYNNMGLWLDKSCIQFFNSTVAPHILEFYPTVGVTRDVNSKPDVKRFALRGLLSVRFCLVPLDKEGDWLAEEVQGWHRAFTSGSYAVYENENYVPMGFTYENYIPMADYLEAPKEERGSLLMRALALTEEQEEAYGSLLAPLAGAEKTDYSYDTYQSDCAARRGACAAEFAADGAGFTAKITLARENLVFFSVPYDDGFTAEVNGAPAMIENVDNGLMAVLCPAGENTIHFTYHTSGLALSAKISAGAAVLFALYLAVNARGRRRRRQAAAEAVRRPVTVRRGPPEPPAAEPAAPARNGPAPGAPHEADDTRKKEENEP